MRAISHKSPLTPGRLRVTFPQLAGGLLELEWIFFGALQAHLLLFDASKQHPADPERALPSRFPFSVSFARSSQRPSNRIQRSFHHLRPPARPILPAPKQRVVSNTTMSDNAQMSQNVSAQPDAVYQQQQSRLFTLPPEIRTMVFEYVVSFDDEDFVEGDDSGRRFWAVYEAERQNAKIFGYLNVCKRLRDELGLYNFDNAVLVSRLEEPSGHSYDFATLSLAAHGPLQSIKHFRVEFDASYMPTGKVHGWTPEGRVWDMLDEVLALKVDTQMLNGAVGLKSVSLDLRTIQPYHLWNLKAHDSTTMTEIFNLFSTTVIRSGTKPAPLDTLTVLGSVPARWIKRIRLLVEAASPTWVKRLKIGSSIDDHPDMTGYDDWLDWQWAVMAERMFETKLGASLTLTWGAEPAMPQETITDWEYDMLWAEKMLGM